MPPPKPVQLKKTAAKAQLKPELKDAKLKKAKKLSSKSAMSESFKRHQEAKKETFTNWINLKLREGGFEPIKVRKLETIIT